MRNKIKVSKSYKKELPKLVDVENVIEHLSYSIKDMCIEFFNKGIEYEKARSSSLTNKEKKQ